jgi:hypothetical protein
MAKKDWLNNRQARQFFRRPAFKKPRPNNQDIGFERFNVNDKVCLIATNLAYKRRQVKITNNAYDKLPERLKGNDSTSLFVNKCVLPDNNRAHHPPYNSLEYAIIDSVAWNAAKGTSLTC